MIAEATIPIACVLSFLTGAAIVAVLRRRQAARAGRTPIEPIPEAASLRDAVTELYNRKHLLQRLKDNIARCDRAQERLALILWDIDGFVGFNNAFGQKEGDRFLKKVAETVRRSLRAYDEAFRAGPDEFCAIVVPADDAIARDVMTRVRDVVSRHLFEEDPEYAGQAFSISAGIAFYPGDHKLPESLLHAAQQSLFRSTRQAGAAPDEAV